MVSIKQLERMLAPYDVGGGFSSEISTYTEYQKGSLTARVDSQNWQFKKNSRARYKGELIKAAGTLKLL